MNNPNRRDFLKAAGLAGLAALVKGCDGNNERFPRKQFAFETKEGLNYNLALECRPDGAYVVDDKTGVANKLHFREANYELVMGSPNAIKLDEYFVMTNTAGTPFTHVLQYKGHDKVNRTLKFRDLATGEREVVYSPSPTYPNVGALDLIVAGINHLSYVDIATGKLVVDFNGDDDHMGTEVPIVDKNGVQTWENQLC